MSDTLPGEWFNREAPVGVPAFTRVYMDPASRLIHCEGGGARWAVRVKRSISRSPLVAVRALALGVCYTAYKLEARPWAIVLGEIAPEVKAAVRAMPQCVLLTGRREWEALQSSLLG